VLNAEAEAANPNNEPVNPSVLVTLPENIAGPIFVNVPDPDTVSEPVMVILPDINELDPVVINDPVCAFVITGEPLLLIDPLTLNEPVVFIDPVILNEPVVFIDPVTLSEPESVGMCVYFYC